MLNERFHDPGALCEQKVPEELRNLVPMLTIQRAV